METQGNKQTTKEANKLKGEGSPPRQTGVWVGVTVGRMCMLGSRPEWSGYLNQHSQQSKVLEKDVVNKPKMIYVKLKSDLSRCLHSCLLCLLDYLFPCCYLHTTTLWFHPTCSYKGNPIIIPLTWSMLFLGVCVVRKLTVGGNTREQTNY